MQLQATFERLGSHRRCRGDVMLMVLLGLSIEGTILNALLLLLVHPSLAWHCLHPTGHELLF